MVARVAMIMNVFDRTGRAQRLDQVVTQTGLPRSSVHRILTQLHDARLLGAVQREHELVRDVTGRGRRRIHDAS